LLEQGYLIRGDMRGQSTWYELTHDRLIRAVQASNEMWRWDKLEPWQTAAHEWNVNARHEAYLLPVDELPSPQSRGSLTDTERAFIEASETRKRESNFVTQIRAVLRFLATLAGIEAVVIAVLAIVLLVR
jgi:hypothetical protein